MVRQYAASMSLTEHETTRGGVNRLLLGPDAFTCAVSYASSGTEMAQFTIRDLLFMFRNDAYDYFFDSPKGRGFEGFKITPGKVQEYSLTELGNRDLTFRWTMKDELRTIGAVEPYPVDMQIVNP